MKPIHKAFTLYVLAYVITVGFLTAIKLAPLWFFIPGLLLMHAGILLFAVSKRMFLKTSMDVGKYYQKTYKSLMVFLPVLLYRLGAYILPYNVSENGLLIGTITAVIIVSVIGVVTLTTLYKTTLKHAT